MVRRATGWRRPLPGVLVTAAAWAAGLDLVHAALLGGATLVVTTVLRDLDPEPDPVWAPVRVTDPGGARRELAYLTWTMTGRDGRVGERALHGLQDAAESRLARHGLPVSLRHRGEDPAPGDDAARALLGERAWRTLTTADGRLPRYADVEHTVGVLERLGPTRAAPAPPAVPVPEPAPVRTTRRPLV
ncbi:hypothetical protein [Cellulomonas hominis]